MTELESLRALRDALPQCEHFDARGARRCRRLATREYANAPGYTRACDNVAHAPRDANNYPLRDLPYARELRLSLELAP